MENATKVLIIAGAILVSIIVISLGVMIVNGATDVINSSVAGMSDYDKDMFNSKYMSYEGNQMGSSVRALIESVISNNNKNYATAGKSIGIYFTLKTVPDGAEESALNLETYLENPINNNLTKEEAKAFATAATKLKGGINTGARYIVEIEKDTDTNLVNKITIIEPGAN